MSSGDKLQNWQVQTRIASAPITANGAVITTTETVVGTVSATLTAGRKYKISSSNRGGSTVANDTILMRIREDSISGTEIQVGRIFCPDTDGAAHGPCVMEAEYTAVATGVKTFALCMTRRTGTGNVSLRAGTTSPAQFYIEALPV